MITELIYDEQAHKFELLKYTPIAVKDYGSEGCTPTDIRDCVRADGPNDYVSCVSSSGDSICCNFFGHISNNVVRCVDKRNDR